MSLLHEVLKTPQGEGARPEGMRDILTLSSHRASASPSPHRSKRHSAVEPDGPPHVNVTQIRGRSWIEYSLGLGEVSHEVLGTLGFVLEVVGVGDEPGLEFCWNSL